MLLMSRSVIAGLAALAALGMSAATPARAGWPDHGSVGFGGSSTVAGPYDGLGYGYRHHRRDGAAIAAGIVGLGALGVAAAIAANRQPAYYAAPVYDEPVFEPPVYGAPVLVYRRPPVRAIHEAYEYGGYRPAGHVHGSGRIPGRPDSNR